jgi:serine protease AprX
VDRVQEHPDPVLASPVAAAAPRVRRSGTIDYGPSRGQLDMLRVPVAHEVGLQGQGTLVAVIDSGFDGLAHPAFAATQVADRWDFVDGDTIVEGASHGTTTFSVIGGYHPGHLVGVAFGARFLLARVGPSEDEMVAAVEWAEARGADVVTMSVGVEMGAERMDGRTASITIAADRAVERGVVVVMSAGNFGYSPAANTLAAPADGFGVLGVGAVHPSGPWAIFSSVGPTADGRIKPDLVAQGVDVQVAWPFGVASYRRSSGTSYSCPLVAGVGALLLQAHPDWTPGQVANALRETASRAAQPDNRLGWGIPDVVGALSYEP